MISTTGVIGDPSVHNEPIGVMSVMADSYGHAAHRCGNYGPIWHSTNRCASKLLVTQATPRTAGSAGLRHMAHYCAIMPHNTLLVLLPSFRLHPQRRLRPQWLLRRPWQVRRALPPWSLWQPWQGLKQVYTLVHPQ